MGQLESSYSKLGGGALQKLFKRRRWMAGCKQGQRKRKRTRKEKRACSGVYHGTGAIVRELACQTGQLGTMAGAGGQRWRRS